MRISLNVDFIECGFHCSEFDKSFDLWANINLFPLIAFPIETKCNMFFVNVRVREIAEDVLRASEVNINVKLSLFFISHFGCLVGFFLSCPQNLKTKMASSPSPILA